MNYEEFKSFVVTHLWKVGDQVVIDNLPQIIKTAEAELNRRLKLEDRMNIADVIVTNDATTLPSDYRSIRHCFSRQFGKMSYITPADMADRIAGKDCKSTDFTVVNKTIILVPGVFANNTKLQLWYYTSWFPFADLDFTDTENQPIYGPVEEYFDVYLYCVLKHTAPFLREDERIPVWAGMYGEALNSALEENDDRKYAGSPLKMKFKK